MAITVGLDFGTHQSKVCIEDKKGAIREYSFMKFKDSSGKYQYTLPSILGLEKNGQVKYGYLPSYFNGKIIRYFKQATFCTTIDSNISAIDALNYSIWYLAYIIFDLEEKYGANFIIQMGVPADSSTLAKAKEKAIMMIGAAFTLVEQTYQNNKSLFLNATVEELERNTKIAIEEGRKENFGTLVFPEAYACLKPLTSRGKIDTGMSLMVDIGGGTTDISFFAISKSGNPLVYDFFSINKGLNYLTRADFIENRGLDSNVKSVTQINDERNTRYYKEMVVLYNDLRQRLVRAFNTQTELAVHRLLDALKGRPLIYCGGGSTFSILRKQLGEFKDIILISDKYWEQKNVKDLSEIRGLNLCPILSTAYGLAISVTTDHIEKASFNEIFKHLKGWGEDNTYRRQVLPSYFDTWRNKIYGLPQTPEYVIDEDIVEKKVQHTFSDSPNTPLPRALQSKPVLDYRESVSMVQLKNKVKNAKRVINITARKNADKAINIASEMVEEEISRAIENAQNRQSRRKKKNDLLNKSYQKRQDIVESVLELIKRKPGITPQNIAKELNYPLIKVVNILNNNLRGVVVNDKKDRWYKKM